MNKEIKLTEQETDFLLDLLKEIYSDDLSNTSKVIVTNLIDKLNND